MILTTMLVFQLLPQRTHASYASFTTKLADDAAAALAGNNGGGGDGDGFGHDSRGSAMTVQSGMAALKDDDMTLARFLPSAGAQDRAVLPVDTGSKLSALLLYLCSIITLIVYAVLVVSGAVFAFHAVTCLLSKRCAIAVSV
jgi:hypothetical protein